MLQVVLHQFPEAHSVYEFRCRNAQTVYPLADIKDELEQELDALCQLRFSADELHYLRGLRFIKSDFVDLLGAVPIKTPLCKTSAQAKTADCTFALKAR